MLTENQINNINKLDTQTKIQILHECAESLGLVSIDEYCRIMAIKNRNIYYKIKQGKIKSVFIGNHIFAIIND